MAKVSVDYNEIVGAVGKIAEPYRRDNNFNFGYLDAGCGVALRGAGIFFCMMIYMIDDDEI